MGKWKERLKALHQKLEDKKAKGVLLEKVCVIADEQDAKCVDSLLTKHLKKGARAL